MDNASWVEVVPVLGLAIALASCAGLRTWLPLLLAGGLSRVGLFELGASFSFLSSNKALAIFALATLLEIVADKFPAVDHALDTLSTVLRPAAGALLAAAAFGRVTDPTVAWILGVAVGSPAALVPHVAKSGLRLASTAFTAGLANPIVSLIEDVTTVMMFVLAVLAPAAVCLLLLGLAYLTGRRMMRRHQHPAAA
jgi:hypothetical protein